MVAELRKLHAILDVFVVVVLNAIVPTVLSDEAFRKEVAFVSSMWTI